MFALFFLPDQTGSEACGAEGTMKSVGLDTIPDPMDSPSQWPRDFEKKQQEIIKLWNDCNVSLIHRTYFFLLFKGDPADSIYMEVELRRLSFLKRTFSQGNSHLETRYETASIKKLTPL